MLPTAAPDPAAAHGGRAARLETRSEALCLYLFLHLFLLSS
jgi:hypothetical protein